LSNSVTCTDSETNSDKDSKSNVTNSPFLLFPRQQDQQR
jgi:hypothetical protein